MEKYHKIENISLQSGRICLTVDGKILEFKLDKISQRLANATEEQLNNFEVSPSGYGIHWPLIDEDISVDALLGITHHPNQERKRA